MSEYTYIRSATKTKSHQDWRWYFHVCLFTSRGLKKDKNVRGRFVTRKNVLESSPLDTSFKEDVDGCPDICTRHGLSLKWAMSQGGWSALVSSVNKVESEHWRGENPCPCPDCRFWELAKRHKLINCSLFPLLSLTNEVQSILVADERRFPAVLSMYLLLWYFGITFTQILFHLYFLPSRHGAIRFDTISDCRMMAREVLCVYLWSRWQCDVMVMAGDHHCRLIVWAPSALFFMAHCVFSWWGKRGNGYWWLVLVPFLFEDEVQGGIEEGSGHPSGAQTANGPSLERDGKKERKG